MYISITEATISTEPEEATASLARVHEFMATMAGFRWAMVLRSLDTPATLAAVSMWLTPEQASAQEGTGMGGPDSSRGFDVTTARGSMTPATHVAIVEWEVRDEEVARFTNRWNAVYHHIEDRIGSRLLRDLGSPGRYAGLHAVTDETNLNPEALGVAITDDQGLSVSAKAVHRFEVIGLTGE